MFSNDLNRRKFEVVFVERKRNGSGARSRAPSSDGGALPADEFTSTWIRLTDEERRANDERIRWGSDRRPSVDPVGASRDRPWRGKFGEKEIEEEIVKELIRRHDAWIAGQ